MSTLPPLYDRWITELLGETVQPEPLATCTNCAMCAGGGTGQRPPSRIVLSPSLKCCTYAPQLPNYQVGGILTDTGPYADAARAQIRARMGGGREVNPLGVGLTPERKGLDDALSNLTGAHAEQRCPHLLDTELPSGPVCAIWRHRDAVCSSWWCRYERGAAGLRFWWSLRFLFRGLEYGLALWCCLEEGLEPEPLYLLMGSEGQPRGANVGAELTRAQLWGQLAGDEEAFYIRCAQRVEALSWEDVLRVSGPTVSGLARHTQHQHQRLRDPLPQRLKVGAHVITQLSAEGALVETYSGYDPIGLPADFTQWLHKFDGRPVEEVLAELEVEVTPEVLRLLVDFGVLVGAS